MVAQQFQIQAHEMDHRLQDMSPNMQSVTREAQGFSQQASFEESKKALFNAGAEFEGSLLMQETSIESTKTTFRASKITMRSSECLKRNKRKSLLHCRRSASS